MPGSSFVSIKINIPNYVSADPIATTNEVLDDGGSGGGLKTVTKTKEILKPP